MRIGLLALVALAALFAGSDEADAAAPWFIFVHGPLLAEPVLLDDWDENHALMLAIPGGERRDTKRIEGRQYLQVALFWGPDWQDYPRDAAAIARLSSAQANQHGRFYPAVSADQPALFLFESAGNPSILLAPRIVEAPGLAVLDARGVPTRIEPTQSGTVGRPSPLLGVVLTLTLAGLVGAALVDRRRRTKGAR